MVDNENGMTMEEFDQLVANNPPGTPAPDPDEGNGAQDPASTAGTSGAAANDSQNNSGTNGTQTSSSQNTQPAQPNKHATNEAFAAMRIQNKKMSDALAAVLQQHGLDPNLAKDPDQLIRNAEEARLEEEAQRQKVPTELLKRLTQLENESKEAQQQRLTNLALAGFKTVKEQFGLDDQGIANFARQLQEAGTNPFEQEMDLVQAYKMHNLDAIIAAETQKAVEEALKKQNTSTQFSTTPSKAQGKESTGTDKIDTMAKFDRFLMGLSN